MSQKFNKKVVIVSYNFPPVGGAGVQRPVKFVKYLRAFGWEPVVLSVSNPSVPVVDNSLMRDIPEDVKIYRAKTLEPSYSRKQDYASSRAGLRQSIKKKLKNIMASCLLPDLQILWWPCLMLELIRIIMKEKPCCLFVTAPPFSSFVPVVALGSIFKIPVVLDFRDEWSFSRSTWENAAKHRLAYFFDSMLEKYVVSKCQSFSAANNSYIQSIYKSYPKINNDKGHVITNGYDEEDFLYRKLNLDTIGSKNKINIVYTGSVWKATSLSPFVSALIELLDTDPLIVEKVSVKIYGRVVDEEKFCLKNKKVSKIIELYDYCDHDMIIREIQNADILLISLIDLPGAEKIITGKAFEYMASGKHIFAMVPEGETRSILSENYDCLSFVHPNDHEGICAALCELFENIDGVRGCLGKDVSQFSRKRLTECLARVLDDAISIK